jgi:hypothetical protein
MSRDSGSEKETGGMRKLIFKYQVALDAPEPFADLWTLLPSQVVQQTVFHEIGPKWLNAGDLLGRYVRGCTERDSGFAKKSDLLHYVVQAFTIAQSTRD